MAKVIKAAIMAVVVVYLVVTGIAFIAGTSWGAAAGVMALSATQVATMYLTAFIGTLVAGGIGMLSSKGVSASGANFGTKVSGRNGAAPRQLIYGTTRVGGTIVKMDTRATKNGILGMTIVVAGHECDGFDEVYFGETKLSYTTATVSGETVHSVTSAKFTNSDNDLAFGSSTLVRFTFHDGSQTAVDGLASAGNSTRYPATAKFLGCSYFYFELVYDPENMPSIPAIWFVMRGKNIWDPRANSGNGAVSTTDAQRQNPALQIRDYLVDTTYGLKSLAGELNDGTGGGGFSSAANTCDQLVTLTVDGNGDPATQERRYTSNGFSNYSASGSGLIESITTSCAGNVTYTNGKFNLFVGASQTPALSITDDNVLGSPKITTQSMSGELFNSVKSIFVNKGDNYQTSEVTQYNSATYLAADTPSGEASANFSRTLELRYPFTTSETTAQRLQRISLDHQRQSTTLEVVTSLEFMKAQPNDWIYVTNSRLGYVNKIFEIQGMSMTFLENEGNIFAATSLQLQEMSASVFGFAYNSYSTPQPNSGLPVIGELEIDPPTIGTPVQITNLEGQTAKINIKAVWTNAVDSAIQGTEIQFKKSTEADSLYVSATLAGKSLTSAEIANVTVGVTYNIRVRHFSFDNVYSVYSSVANIAIAQPDTITNPTNLAVTTDKPFNIELSWTNPANTNMRAVDVHYGTNTSYTPSASNRIGTYYGDIGKKKTVLLGRSHGLSYDTNYYFKIIAVNIYGSVPESGGNPVYVTSPAGQMKKVTTVDVDEISANKLSAGIIDADVITVNNLDADKITSGELTLTASAASAVKAGKSSYEDATTAGFFLGFTNPQTGSRVEGIYIGTSTNGMRYDTAGGLVVSGNISATTGSIGGFTISATALTAGTGVTRVSLSTADGIHLGDNTFNSAPFKVTRAGALTATGATINGAITSSSGTIGGFTLSATSLQAGSGTTRVSLSTADGIHLGDNTFGSAPFRVTRAGAVTATSGVIGGFTLGSTSLIAGANTTRVSLSTADGISLGNNTFGSAPFRVTPAGALTADSATLTSATVSGAITATSGSLSSLAISGALTVGTSGKITGGTSTSFNTGVGFFLGYDSSAYKFSIGDASTNKNLTWDGTDIKIGGAQITASDNPSVVIYDARSGEPPSVTSARVLLTSDTNTFYLKQDYTENLVLTVSYPVGALTSGTVSGEQAAIDSTMATFKFQIYYATTSSPTSFTQFGSDVISSRQTSTGGLISNYLIKTTNLGGGNYKAELQTKTEVRTAYPTLSGLSLGVIDDEYNLIEKTNVSDFPAGEYVFKVVVTVTDGSASSYPATGSPASNLVRSAVVNGFQPVEKSGYGYAVEPFYQPLTTYRDGSASEVVRLSHGNDTLEIAAITRSGHPRLVMVAGRGPSSTPSDTLWSARMVWAKDHETYTVGSNGDYLIGLNDSGSHLFLGKTKSNPLLSELQISNGRVDVIGSLYVDGTEVTGGGGSGTITNVIAGTNLNGGGTSGAVTLSLDSTISGNHTFSNNLIISGNLTVNGTTTTVDTDNLNVKDKNITLNYSTGDSSSTANGAGITIQDAVNSTTNATMLWDTTNDEFDFSHNITAPNLSISNWNTAYGWGNPSGVYLPLAGGTLTGGLSGTTGAFSSSLTATSLDVSGLVEFNSLSGTGSVAITNILDEDNMASNSATALATQQSIKAYVLANVNTGSFLPLSGGTLTGGLSGTTASFSSTLSSGATTISGVGTSSSAYALRVYNGASTPDDLLSIKDDGTIIMGGPSTVQVTKGLGLYVTYNLGVSGLIYKTGGADVEVSGSLRINSGGLKIGTQEVITSGRNLTNIGTIAIGSASPQNSAKVDIYSSVTSGHFNGLQIRRPNSSGITSAMQFTLANNIMVGKIQHDYVASNHNDMSFHLRLSGGSNQEVMRFYAGPINGTRVGIGTTQPEEKLTVSGNIRASGSYLVGGTTVIDSSRKFFFDAELYGNSKRIFTTSDTYLRMNQSSEFGAGIWIGTSNLMTSNGYISAGSNGGTTTSRVYIKSGAYNGTNVIAIDGTDGKINSSYLQIGGTTVISSARDISNIGGITAVNLTASGTVSGLNHYVIAGDGNKLGFWGGSTYTIHMASSGSGGRVAGETTSDYNMYFTMSGGTNRGFNFRNGTANVAGIDASGNGRFTGTITSGAITSSGVITATGGNSTQWNTAYSWGNPSGVYLPLAGGTLTGTLAMGGNGITSTGTISSGAITTSNIIKVDAGHDTARMQLVYDDQSALSTKGTLTAWVSEPGLTYSDAGIGANIYSGGQYYGRQFDDGWGVYARFRKSTGAFEVWNTQGTAGTTGGQGTQRLNLSAAGVLNLPTGSLNVQSVEVISSGRNLTAVAGTFTDTVTMSGSGILNITKGLGVYITNNLSVSGLIYKTGGGDVEVSGNLRINSGGLKIGTQEVITSGRNLTNIGTISSGAITSTGTITANHPLTLNNTIAGNDTGDFKILQSLNAAGGVGYAASILGVNIDTAVNSSNFPTQDNVWGGVTGSAALVMSADISDGLNSFRFMATPQASAAGTALSTVATIDFEGGFTANGYIRSDSSYKIGTTTVIDASRNLTNIVDATIRGDIDTRTAQNTTQTEKLKFGINNGNAGGTSDTIGGGIEWSPLYGGYSKRSAGILAIGEGNYFRAGLAFYTNNTANATTDWSERMRLTMEGNLNLVSGSLTMGGNTVISSARAVSASTADFSGKADFQGTAAIEGGTTSSGYGLFKGYSANYNHFMASRGIVTGSTASPTLSGGHQMTFVEYVANAADGFRFKSSNTGTYAEIAYINRVGINTIGAYHVNGATVIDASRNVSNVNMVKFRDHVSSFYISPTNTNTLNAGYDQSGNAVDMWINYRGYQDGITQFRDFRIGDGKNIPLLFVDGSARAFDFQSSSIIQMGGTTVIDASRNATFGTKVTSTYEVIIGNSTTPTYTYEDNSTRSKIYLSDNYPVICLNGEGSNANHGPTIQFTGSGSNSNRQFVIGSSDTAAQLDFGWGTPANKNPHVGISGYSSGGGGATLMRITTTGVGIGGNWGYYGTVANPAFPLHVQGEAFATGSIRSDVGYKVGTTTVIDASRNAECASYAIGAALPFANTNSDLVLNDKKLYLRGTGDANHYLWNNASDWEELVAYAGTGFKITSSTGGNMATFSGAGAVTLSGTTTISGSHSSTITTPNINSFGALSAGTAYNYHIMFKQANGTVRGQITNNIYGTQYTTSSDYRLKENVQPLSSSTSRTLALNPCTFEWIDDADNNSIEGFLAHEVAAIVPEAVVGTKDALDADGNPEYQTIDQSKLIPILVKTIQELEARITALESA